MERERQAISWRQRSVDWMPPERYSIASKVHMFVEDLRLYIVPYDDDARNQVVVRGESDDARELVAVLVGARGYRDVNDQVARYIRDLMWPLAHEGGAIHEIVAGTREGSEAPPIFRLKRLPGGPVIKIGPHYLQLIPRHVRGQRQRWVRIPADAIWKIQLPSALGRPSTQKRLIRRLRRLSSPAPEFAIADLQRAGQIGYDVRTYWRESEMATAQATRSWGWPSRWAWREFSTEYYQFYREVWFRRSITILLHHVVSEMNALLKRLAIGATIEIENPVTAGDIEAGLALLKRGEWDFARLREENLL